ncbi:hypothetical protein PR202_gb03939 [Eleusine coracana subsp. coracana]|uniref:Nucleotide-diphospho-sugar transferase domain-containing protein n=1 Tax=Eleusine coracana subsp. coracana TaxID=191504 RepID=A0AAV5E377_ELECO|nr:hypothetical protein QOZ80_1BG0094640 [Eleusine coracana subsp. coracana]GJN16913.1 hypothetical protein PR202_gb03939 [Eleusine coracana subsp. coracana]
MGFAGGKEGSHMVSFLLGAVLPTAFLFFLASDRLGEGFSRISMSWGNGTTTPVTPAPEAHAQQDHEIRFPGLAELLPKVAMEDRTVILTMVNEAWAQPNSLLDLQRESFKNGEDIAHLLNHVIVIAVDAGGFRGCKAVHPHCYLLELKSTNLSSEERFMTKEFLELVWLKVTFQQTILELGYNFLFTDTDILWFRNPFRHITLYADMTCSTDYFRPPTSSPMDKTLNTGFYYMKSTNRSIEMIKYWRAARERFPGDNEQGVFNKIKNELVSKLQARIVALDTAYFGGFCEYNSDLGRICTIHANCCIGLENKVPDLRDKAAEWKNYTSLTPEERKKGGFKWTAPARCWKTIGWSV